jgi:hypothetical protein
MTLQATNNFLFDTTYFSELLGQPPNPQLKTYIWFPYSFLPGTEGQVCNIMGAIKAEKSTLYIQNNSLSQKDTLHFTTSYVCNHRGKEKKDTMGQFEV